MYWVTSWSLLWIFFFSSRRRHTRYWRDWSSDVCSSDLRVVEALPDDRALVERRRDGQALTNPELCVLLAYAKIQVGDAVLHSGLPDDPALEELLSGYFPAALRRRFPTAISSHPLRREIIATALTNRAVNTAGITGVFRLAEETGAPLTAVVRAHAVARAVDRKSTRPELQSRQYLVCRLLLEKKKTHEL